MPATWKTVRVFISSTFRDMQAERDHLVRFVFPKLREELVKYRIHLVDVDLRWGVTGDQDALGVCREVIDDCHPRFMCMLGGRYGWVPEGQDKSITADEIHYGVLGREAEARGLAFFYFRREADTLAIPDDAARAGGYREFPQPDEIERHGAERAGAMARERAQKLITLKKAITDAGLPIFIYSGQWDTAQMRLTGLETFGTKVHADLFQSLKDDPELSARFTDSGTATPDEFAEESDQMDAFIEERTDRFILGSRDPLMRDMLDFAAADGPPNIFVLTGEPGSGKSAFLAKFTRDLTALQPPSFVLPHFIGASTGSTDLRRTLRRLCHELALAAGNTESLPLDIKELITHFHALIAEAAGKQHVILVFDALNQFDATDGAHWLNWLPQPDKLPPGVRIVASVIAPADGQPEHQTLAILRTRPGAWMEKLEPLTEADSLAIIEGCLRRYAKRLSPEQLTALLAKPAGRLPLYVLTALEELRTLGTYEEITDRIRTLPGDARALFGWILTERLARDPGFRDHEGRPCGAALVEKFAACLGVSRHGLSPAELTALLDPGDPLGNVAALLRLLRPYLMRRGELLDFYHGQFREAAAIFYLPSESQRLAAHHQLASYFRDLADPKRSQSWEGDCPRPFLEVVFHLVGAERVDDYCQTLCDLRFVAARCRVGQVFDLIADYRLAREKLPEAQADLLAERAREERVRRWTAEIIDYARLWNDRRDRLARGEAVTEPEPKLPEPVPTCEVWSEEKIQAECDRIVQTPTRRDRLEAFASFVGGQSYPLLEHGRRPGFVLQHAFNTEPAGAVHDAAVPLLAALTKIHLLRRWPPEARHNPTPALLQTLTGHRDFVRSVSVTPDGRRAVSGSNDKALRVWDLASGECLRTLDAIGSVYSATPDGRHVISASSQGEDVQLRLWDLSSGQCLRTIVQREEGRIGNVESMSVTPDGRLAVTGHWDNTLRVWNLESGACVRTLKGHTGSARSVSEDPDGPYADHMPTYAVNCVSVTPDGLCAVSSSGIGISGRDEFSLHVWDLQSGQCRWVLKGHTDRVSSITLTPDGRWALSGSGDKTVRLWNLADGRCLRTLAGHQADVSGVGMTPDGRLAISGSYDGTMRVWALETGHCIRTAGGAYRGITSVSLTPDGRRVVSASLSQDRAVRVWDLERGACIRTTAEHSGISSVGVTPDGRWAVSANGQDHTIRVWDITNGQLLRTLIGHSGLVNGLCVTPDGRRVVSISGGETRVWDLASGQCLRTLEYGGRCVSVTPDGRCAVSQHFASSLEIVLRVWDLSSGNCLRTLSSWDGLRFAEDMLKEVGSTTISSVRVTPDGRRAVTGDYDNMLRVWSLEGGQPVRKLTGHENRVEDVAVTPDGRRAISGSGDQTVRVWDLERRRCLRVLEGHRDGVESVVVAPDGRWAVSGSLDQTVRVWDLESGQCLSLYIGAAPCRSVALDGTRNVICAGIATGEVLFLELHRVPSGPAILTAANLQQARCPECGQEFAPPSAILTAIQEGSRKGELSCLDLPASAFVDPRLLSACQYCQHPLQLNPFFAAADDYAEILRRGLEQSRREKGSDHEETLAHLAALAAHFEQLGQAEVARPFIEEHARLKESAVTKRMAL